MKYSKYVMLVMIAEVREACKRLRKLGMMRKTVATYRLKELRHLHAVEKLATWRRTYGFDRLEDGDDHWVHGPLPPTPEPITASLWSDLNALKDAVSMSGKERSRQKVKSFINELSRGTVSFTDEKFARLKRIVERRGRDTAHMTVASIDTAQYCNPRSRCPKKSFDTRVYMEKNDKSRMVPERDQLEPPSAGTGFETPGQQCQNKLLPRAACSLVWVRIWGGTPFPPQSALSGREPVA